MTKATTKAQPEAPPVLVFEENETFVQMDMIATMIDGVVHFSDRSYVRAIGRAERNVGTIVEDNLPELELYGTVHVAHAPFSPVGSGA